MSDSQSRSSAIKAQIPELGLTEYWYPATFAKKVKRRPVGVRMLGETLVLFRGRDGHVAAASNTCPHRGGSLMHGVCHYKGTVACPYHGWVFDERGECVAVLSEGPESAMPGKVRLRIYPTAEYKGLVFVWMGNGKPVPVENEIPPEFFEGGETALFISARRWDVNWRVALENSLDSHVMYVHRNALLQLMEPYQQFGRTGYSPRIVNGRAAIGYLRDPPRTGREFYPGLDDYWPKTEWRRLWLWIFAWRNARIRNSRPFLEDNEEWGMHTRVDGRYVRSAGHHLPSMFRFDFGGQMFTRFCVPIDAETTRVFYIHAARRKTRLGRALRAAYYHLFRNWALNINFSTQDYRVMAAQDYDAPEMLSASDGQLVRWRRLLLTARGMPDPRDPPAGG